MDEFVISHGGTVNWQRKENQVAAVKADTERVRVYNVPNVDELYLLIKQRNTPRGFHQLIPNWQEN
jgi:hypothetical protein